jgi:hypothetical protein
LFAATELAPDAFSHVDVAETLLLIGGISLAFALFA